MFAGVLVVVIFICVAMMWTEGMWGNALTLINVIFATMIALNFFEPVANMLESKMSSFTYVLDFLSMWLLFIVTLLIFRTCTDQISKHQVRFKLPVEQAGRLLFAMATAWVMVCFVTTSMHTAPLARTPFRGSFQKDPLSNNFFSFAPDRLLLGFMHSRSKGAMSSGKVFDEKGEYILKYGARRKSLRDYNVKEGAIRVGK